MTITAALRERKMLDIDDVRKLTRRSRTNGISIVMRKYADENSEIASLEFQTVAGKMASVLKLKGAEETSAEKQTLPAFFVRVTKTNPSRTRFELTIGGTEGYVTNSRGHGLYLQTTDQDGYLSKKKIAGPKCFSIRQCSDDEIRQKVEELWVTHSCRSCGAWYDNFHVFLKEKRAKSGKGGAGAENQNLCYPCYRNAATVNRGV